MRYRILGAILLVLFSVTAYALFVGIIILISPWTGPQGNTPPILHDFLYYWDSILVLLVVNALGSAVFSLSGYSSRIWIGAYILCATVLVLATFESELYVGSGLWMIRKYAHYIAPSLGALTGAWIASYIRASVRARK